MMQLAIIGLGMVLTIGIIVFAFAGPSAAKAQAQQLEKIKFRYSDSAQTKVEAQLKKAISARKRRRRGTVENPSRLDELANRLERTGKKWTIQNYFYASLGLMVVTAAGLWLYGAPLLLSLGAGLVIGVGLPHLAVGFLISQRLSRFNQTFPDGIELIVRGLRSGLPVAETIGVVAQEIPGPVGEEFAKVVQRIKIGNSMEDALAESAKVLNTPEFKFFCITLAIQRETGGNLAETLSNLSNVLRNRAQMKLKIRAMSSESKASAYIVGSLPFIVFALVYMVNPSYVAGFFYEERLIIAGIGGLVWMGIGVFIMAKMVSFEI